jgi:hypothetical protein
MGQEKLIKDEEIVETVEEACLKAEKKLLENRLRREYDCAEHEIEYAKANY